MLQHLDTDQNTDSLASFKCETAYVLCKKNVNPALQ